MAPPRAPLELPTEHPEGYDEFIESLTTFANERGCILLVGNPIHEQLADY